MPNFEAIVRIDYKDIDGLVLDCKDVDLPINAGSHSGSSNSPTLIDSSKSWTPDSLIGGIVHNLTDGSSGLITANTSNTAIATLSGGSDNDWDVGDDYSIMLPDFEWINRAPAQRPLFSGSHGGSSGSASLFDSSQSWRTNQLVGSLIYNRTDFSHGIIISNTSNTVIATLSGGTDNDWDAGDNYIITTPRFGNPYQDTVANCPIITESGGYREASFIRTKSHFLKIPNEYRFPSSAWSIAFEFAKGTDATDQQAVLGLESGFPDFRIYRLTSGNYAYQATSLVSGSGDMDDGVWFFGHDSSSSAKMYLDGVVKLSGTAVYFDIFSDAMSPSFPVGAIGSREGVSYFCDMILKNIRIWNRLLSPLEIDFIYKTLAADGSDKSAFLRADMSRVNWTDNVYDYSRVNPTPNANQKFALATIGAETSTRVQVAASVNGKTVPDTELGGDLFSLTPIEIPGTTGTPAVYQTSGWSSIFDVVCKDEGHYTYLLSRSDGGAIILHWDVEASA